MHVCAGRACKTLRLACWQLRRQLAWPKMQCKVRPTLPSSSVRGPLQPELRLSRPTRIWTLPGLSDNKTNRCKTALCLCCCHPVYYKHQLEALLGYALLRCAVLHQLVWKQRLCYMCTSVLCSSLWVKASLNASCLRQCYSWRLASCLQASCCTEAA